MRSGLLAAVIPLLAVGCGTTSEDLGGGFVKPPHFVDSFPRHDDTLTQAPEEIVVNFNFNLHPTATSATLRRNGATVPQALAVAADQLSLRLDLRGANGDGEWVVGLNACWPDASCHEGQFVFRVDPARLTQYKDLSAGKEVTVRMAGIAFVPDRLVVKAGTRVDFLNDEAVTHFVNSDPHPSHNLIAALNSKAMVKGDRYSHVFNRPGEWGFHCSAHTHMTGKIVVRP